MTLYQTNIINNVLFRKGRLVVLLISYSTLHLEEEVISDLGVNAMAYTEDTLVYFSFESNENAAEIKKIEKCVIEVKN